MIDGHFKTSCKKCIFATYKNNKQTGCAAGVFDIFQGSKEFIQDAEKSFFTLENFACRYIRPLFWGKDLSEEEQLHKLNEETMIDLSAAVVISDSDIDKLKNTIDQIVAQTLHFREIVFVNSFNNRHNFKDILRTIEDKRIKIRWSLKQVVDAEIGDQYGIDLAFKSCPSLFIVNIICGQNLPNNFVEKINEYHKKMHKFLVLKPKNDLGHCLVIQSHAYDIVQGNATVQWNDTDEIISDMVTKIQKIASLQNAVWAVRDLSEVCDCLKEI